jgi:putative two-component system response regulator
VARILVVDDSVQATRALTRLLEHIHHTVDWVESGEAAVQYLNAATPDLVILDLMMPGVDGAEVLRQIRSSPTTHGVPVIVYTAIADDSMREYILARGASEYWVKASFNLSELEQRLAALLAR